MYRKMNSGWIKHIDFEIIDIICIEISFLFAYFLRHKEYLSYNFSLYKKLCIVLVFVDVCVIFFSDNYKGIVQRGEIKELIAVVRHVTIVNVLLLVYEYIIKEADILSRMVFVASWAMSIVLCFLARTIWKSVLRRRITSSKNQSKMLLITSEKSVSSCVKELYRKEYREYVISAVTILNRQEEIIDANIPIIYGYSSMLEYIRTNVVDEVYIDTHEDIEDLNELCDVFLSMGVTVHVGLGFLPDDMPNQTIGKVGGCYAVTSCIKTANSWELMIKRVTDIVGAVVGLILCGILFVFVAPAIKMSSKGPILFKQERVGKNGRLFNLYKFRSMYVDAEEHLIDVMDKNEMNGLMFKLENDPRIIGSSKGPGKGLGNFLRKTSIDEFPQFWNILKGDMSLVGTRPPTINEYEQYDLHHKIRLSMKPGLTGMWQVSGRSEVVDFEKVVALDTEYITNWSIFLDLKILLKTITVVFKRKGSK